ncbi:hypothetical protein T05_3807 [Trichinella murrelli]|uniref:Uncharacterized protein n=1 Tax=Trichinella murrelli TaxID=144512 RepID=A0A0V0UC00_9BILA|nr:hypothetical protein T05_3807 [Trichinella murrelli]
MSKIDPTAQLPLTLRCSKHQLKISNACLLQVISNKLKKEIKISGRKNKDFKASSNLSINCCRSAFPNICKKQDHNLILL